MWTYVYIYTYTYILCICHIYHIYIYTMYMSYLSYIYIYIYTMYMYVYVMSVKTPFSFAAQASSHQPTFWAPLLRRQRHGAPAEKRTSTALQLEILRSNRVSNGVHKSAHLAPVRDDSDTKTDQRSSKQNIQFWMWTGCFQYAFRARPTFHVGFETSLSLHSLIWTC